MFFELFRIFSELVERPVIQAIHRTDNRSEAIELKVTETCFKFNDCNYAADAMLIRTCSNYF